MISCGDQPQTVSSLCGRLPASTTSVPGRLSLPRGTQTSTCSRTTGCTASSIEAADPSPSELGAISDSHNHSDVLSFGPACLHGYYIRRGGLTLDAKIDVRFVFDKWSGARDLNPGPHGPESHDSSSKHGGFCAFQFDSSSRRARSVQICTNLRPDYYMKYYRMISQVNSLNTQWTKCTPHPSPSFFYEATVEVKVRH